MNEVIITMFVAATDTEPAYSKVVRVEFDSVTYMSASVGRLTIAPGVTNAEELHA